MPHNFRAIGALLLLIGPIALAMLGATPARADLVAEQPGVEITTAPTPTPEPAPDWGPLQLLGETLAPGETLRLGLPSSEAFSGRELLIPVIAIRGVAPGPTLCLIAGVHGDEVNGIEVVRRTVRGTAAAELRGTLLALPIANLSAFRRGSRYLPDRRDLNRYFPGRTYGSAASRIAYSIFEGVIRHCDALVDLHTGSFHRTNLHHVRVDLDNPDSAALARGYGALLVVHSSGGLGTLRRAATDAGIPAMTVEAGEPARFDEQQVLATVAGIDQLMGELGMLLNASESFVMKAPTSEYRRTTWVRADSGGILLSRVSLGEVVRAGQILGTVTDPLSDRSTVVRAPHSGRVFGLAFDQVVMPGFAAYHLALHGGTSSEAARIEAEGAEAGALLDDELDERPE